MAKSPFTKEAVSQRREERAKVTGYPSDNVKLPEPETEAPVVAIMDEPPAPQAGVVVQTAIAPCRYRVHYAYDPRLFWEGEAESPEEAYLRFAQKNGIVVSTDEKTGSKRVLADHEPLIEVMAPS